MLQMKGLSGGKGSMNDSPVTKKLAEFGRIYQYYLDKTVPHLIPRWAGALILALSYVFRVYFVQGYFLITYALELHFLNMLIEFLTPLVNPAFEACDGRSLPTKDSDEFKPFIRHLPSLSFGTMTKALCIAFVMTFFWVLNIPAYWPILLVGWFGLFVLTMETQIAYMVRYQYIPFSL